MIYSASSSTLTWLWLVVAITSVVLISSSPFPDDDPTEMYSPIPQLLDSSLRNKRMSQISCRCCSNSFNSHCCLNCMQRLGKRGSGATLVDSQPPFVSMLPGIDDLEPHYPDAFRADWAVSDRTCTCCLHQMKRNFPLAELTSCCQQCKYTGA